MQKYILSEVLAKLNKKIFYSDFFGETICVLGSDVCTADNFVIYTIKTIDEAMLLLSECGGY